MTTMAVRSAAERRLLGLEALEPAQAHARRRLGLPERDAAALRRVADRYAPPAWAAGCVSVHDAMFLYDMVRGVRPRRMIEVGVASGCSTALLLIALADTGVAAADGSAVLESFELHPFCYFDRSRPVGSAVAEMAPELAAGLRLHVRGTAAAAGRLLAGAGIDLAFIDADHRHPAPTADLLLLLPALARGAWVVLHDIALPEIARREEERTGKKADWHEHGAEWLFERWPFEKIRGGGIGERIGASNIGAIRLPEDRDVAAADLRELIGLPWEVEPGEAERRALGLAGPAAAGSAHAPVRITGTIEVVSLVAPHGVSGVSSAMAKLAALPAPHHPWKMLAVGPGASGPGSAEVPGSGLPGFGTLAWEAGTRPVMQVRMVRDRLREMGARVVSPNFLAPGFVAAAMDRHRGRRVAAVWHGSELSAEDLYQRVAPLADAWRAVSPAIARRVARYAPATGGDWLPTGVEVPEEFDSPPCTRAHERPLKLLYAAWLDERNKRVLDLAALCDALHKRGVKFELTIAGRGPAQQKLAAALAPHIVAGRAILIGPVPHTQMGRLHRAHDVLVLVSQSEGTPVVVMEAMARGRPVAITGGCGGALAAVRDGIEGIVVDVGDMAAMAGKLAALMQRRGALVGMGARAHAAAMEHFDIGALAAKYDALVEEAAAAETGLTSPEAIADLWRRMLGAMELLGPSTPAELCGLALEWLSDLDSCIGGVRGRVALHITEQAGSLLDAVGIYGPDMIGAAVVEGGTGRWMGYPVLAPADVPPGMLVLSTRPESAGVDPARVLPLTEPWLPGLGARRLARVMADLRARGISRVALYGAGKHTRKLARSLGAFPEIVAVIDDAAGGGSVPERLWGLPVVPPSRAGELGLGAVVVSSDEYERMMLQKARAWAPPGVCIEALYEPITRPGGEIPFGMV